MNKFIKIFYLLFISCLISSCLLCHEASCPSTKPPPEFYATEEIPKISLINGIVSFQSPSILRMQAHNALHQIYVYDENENTILWMIQSQNTCNSETRGDIEKTAQYNPDLPIIYGTTLVDTEEVISPAKLKTDVIYNMRADFTGFDDKNHQHPPTSVKVTFKLIRSQNDLLHVVTLPTRTDYSKLPFLNNPTCNFSQKR